MEFLETYEGNLPNLPRSYGRICCICGSSTTYIYRGTPIWAKYKDEEGKDTGEWTCHSCCKRRKEDKIFKCRLCGSDKTRTMSNGKSIWIKDINIKKEWTGRFLCYQCNYPIRICHKCGESSHHRRIHKHFNSDGYWTGKFSCNKCHIVKSKNIYCSICNQEINKSYYEKLDSNGFPIGKNICITCFSKMPKDCADEKLQILSFKTENRTVELNRTIDQILY